jgi:hypothetical protein
VLPIGANNARARPQPPGCNRRGGKHALPPIVTTTLSIIADMLPIALAIDPGSDTRRASGVVVIGGLTSSLLLTVLIVSIMYMRLAPRDTARTHPLDEDVLRKPDARGLLLARSRPKFVEPQDDRSFGGYPFVPGWLDTAAKLGSPCVS